MKISAFFLGLIIGFPLLAQAAGPDPRVPGYTLSKVLVSQSPVSVTGLSDTGRVACSVTSKKSEPQAFTWANGILTPLTPGDATSSRANAINASGQIVGSISTDGSTQPFTWKDGILTLLAPPAGLGNGAALGINKHGHIVGTCYSNVYESQPVFWKDTVPAILPIAFGNGVAVAINASGQIVGYYNKTPSDIESYRVYTWGIPGGGAIEGADYSASPPLPLSINASGRIAGGTSSHYGGGAFTWAAGDLTRFAQYSTSAIGLSDSGTVCVNFSDLSSETSGTFAWKDGVETNRTTNAFATAINRAGKIAGALLLPASAGSQPTHAVIWASGRMRELPFVNVASSSADAINASGQIVGVYKQGKENVVYLLTPGRTPFVALKKAPPVATRKSHLVIRGTAVCPGSPIVKVTWQVGSARPKRAAGKGAWKIDAPLAEGENVITIVAESRSGKSTPLRLVVTRK